jgi:uncharacterized protein involved in outer membrane biogenesis
MYQSPQDSMASPLSRLSTRWPLSSLDPRQRRLASIGAALLATYALVGFVILLPMARSYAISWLSEETQRDVELAELHVNPFTLSVSAIGFSIADPGQEPLVGFQRLTLNLGLYSLIEQAWVLEDVELVAPHVRLEVDEGGGLNLSSLFPPEDVEIVEHELVDEQDRPVPLSIRHASIQDGVIELVDRSPNVDIDMRFSPLAFESRSC